jgi:hypothetical protein
MDCLVYHQVKYLTCSWVIMGDKTRAKQWAMAIAVAVVGFGLRCIGSAPMEFQDGEFQFNCKFGPTFGDGTLDGGDWCGAGLHFGYFYYHHFGAVVLFTAHTDEWGSYPTCGMAVLQGVRNSVALKKIHVVAALKNVKK